MKKCEYGKVLWFNPQWGKGVVRSESNRKCVLFSLNEHLVADPIERIGDSVRTYDGPRWMEEVTRFRLPGEVIKIGGPLPLPLRLPKHGDRIVFDRKRRVKKSLDTTVRWDDVERMTARIPFAAKYMS